MNFSSFLVISDMPPKPDSHGLSKAIVDGPQYFEIGKAVPIIDRVRQKCLGIARITEIHIGMKFTVVFYQSSYTADPKALFKAYSALENANSSRMPDGLPRRQQSSMPGSSTMDPALAMSMGRAYTPREMAGEDDADDDDMSLAEAMRLAGNEVPDEFWD